MNTPTPAPTAQDTPASTAPTFSTLCALLDEVNQRLTNTEAVNAIIAAEVDALAAHVAALKAAS
jgi:hypothetical protein